MDKQLTDEEIKGVCKRPFCQPAQEIINCQKAEIKRLKDKNEMQKVAYKVAMEILEEDVKTAKSEAYKEFAEKLKNNLVLLSTENFNKKIITELGIEKVLKEMVGDDE